MNRQVVFILIVIALMVTASVGYALQRYTLLQPKEQEQLIEKIDIAQLRTPGVAQRGAPQEQMDSQHGTTTSEEQAEEQPKQPRTPPLISERRQRPRTFAPTVPSPSEVPSKTGSPEAQIPIPGRPLLEETQVHEEKDRVVLPEISPIPGVTFVETMIGLMKHELDGRFLGWRPNDLIIGRFTDNINSFQLGALEAMRFTTMRLKINLTRMGEADSYDKDLEDALNLFMNKATQFWFPSAESQYKDAVKHLERFLQNLKTGERKFYYRTDNLLALVTSYSDLLGNVNRTLVMDCEPNGTPVSWFKTDDYFYYAKGVAHVMYEILKVVRVGFYEQLLTIDAVEIMDQILHELHRAENMDPWIILDADLDGIFANHRANLNAPLSEVAHLMTVMSRF